MGVFKKFAGCIALESLQTLTSFNDSSYGVNNTTTFKAMTGYVNNNVTTDNNIHYRYIPFADLTPFASSDSIATYALENYTATSVGTASTGKSRTNDKKSILYNVSIAAGNTDITVNSVMFTKKVFCKYNTSSTDWTDVLICAYYLDAPLTIPAGESRTITIEMKVGTDVSVNET